MSSVASCASREVEHPVAPPTVAGAPRTLEVHVDLLTGGLPVLVRREIDYVTCRARIVAVKERRADGLPRYLIAECAGGPPRESWKGAACFVGYDIDGEQWSFRSVVRALDGARLTVDAPAEVRSFAPPRPGVTRRPVALFESPGGRFESFSFFEERDAAVVAFLADLPDHDPFLQETRKAQLVRHPQALDGLVTLLSRRERCALAIEGDLRLHAVALVPCPLPGGAAGLRLIFEGRPPDVPTRSRSGIALTGIIDRHVYGVPLKVHSADADGLWTYAPRRAFRYDRRRAKRYDLRHMDLKVVVQWSDGQTQGTLLDLSISGAGVQLGAVPPIPSDRVLALAVLLPNGREIKVDTTCVSVRSVANGRVGGFQFVELDPTAERLLTELVTRDGHLRA